MHVKRFLTRGVFDMKKKTLLFRLAALVMLAVFISSCSSSTIKGANVTSKIYKDSNASVEDRVKDLLSQLTVEEKAGQMLQVEKNYLHNSDIKNYGLGSLLSGGGSTPRENSPEGWIDMLEDFQKKALETPHAIPLIYGADAVHGHNSLLGAVIFPHNIFNMILIIKGKISLFPFIINYYILSL